LEVQNVHLKLEDPCTVICIQEIELSLDMRLASYHNINFSHTDHKFGRTGVLAMPDYLPEKALL